MDSNSKFTCPNICPNYVKTEENKRYMEAGELRNIKNPNESPYVPGQINPPEPKIYPRDAPPRYLPQPGDSTSGDILGMGPIGPWAAGHLDWSPQAGMTGVRPVVDKYSITKYSTGEWRKNNANTLNPRTLDNAKSSEKNVKKDIENTFAKINEAEQNSNKNLEQRIKDLAYWKGKVSKAVADITEEIEILDGYRARLKGASRILMLPEAISRECLELRTYRFEPDLVRDEAEQELIKEVSIVGEIRRIFGNTLAKVEHQMENLRAAKAAIDLDWSDKMVSYKLDKNNLRLTPDSNLVLQHPGAARWTENSTTLEYWLHYCSESIRNCEEVRKASVALRADLMNSITKGSEDMKNQAERTNAALKETIETTEALCDKLEDTLKNILQQIADTENLIDLLKESLRQVAARTKGVNTRLHARNNDRPNVENCKDNAHYALMAEAKCTKESSESLQNRLRETELFRLELLKKRGDLEKDIACKRKSLNIDRDRCSRVRAHMPSPEEFAVG